MRVRSAWAAVPTLAVTWLAFAQVLSLSGLAIWVVGGSVLAYALTSALGATGHRLLAMVGAVAVTAVVPVLANTLGGDSAGPITRSSLMAVGVGAAMGVMLRTGYPLSLLGAAVILLGGATGLGAAGRAPWLVGAWVVAAAATVVMLGPYTPGDLVDRRRLARLAAIMAIAGLVAVASVAVATPMLRLPWTMPGAAAIDDTTSVPEPPPPSSAPEPPPPTSAPEPPPTDTPVDPVDHDAVDATSVVVAIIFGVTLLLVLLIAARFAWQAIVWLQWRSLRRRLHRGDPTRRVVGAWTWIRLRRYRYDDPLPPYASPDVVADAVIRTDPSTRTVARLAAMVAFDPEAATDAGAADRAWAAADVAGRPPSDAGVRRRWAWGRRRPRSVSRDLAASRSDPVRASSPPSH